MENKRMICSSVCRVLFCWTGCLAFFFLLSCDDDFKNPGYPATPSIKFKKIKFIEVGGVADYDTLRLTISYKDGDSDLGLSNSDPADSRYPYHYMNYFLETGEGDTNRVVSETIGTYEVIRTDPGAGLLVTSKTRQKAGYSYLPPYNNNSCLNYTFLQALVSIHSADETFDIRDTIVLEGKKFIRFNEAVLYAMNENYYNLGVEFYQSDDGINFTEFDWFAEYCISYHGRFPFIDDKRSGTISVDRGIFKIHVKTPWEGEIRYSMANTSFLQIFGDKYVKLKITIKDRTLHTSNTIETPAFKLKDIE